MSPSNFSTESFWKCSGGGGLDGGGGGAASVLMTDVTTVSDCFCCSCSLRSSCSCCCCCWGGRWIFAGSIVVVDGGGGDADTIDNSARSRTGSECMPQRRPLLLWRLLLFPPLFLFRMVWWQCFMLACSSVAAGDSSICDPCLAGDEVEDVDVVILSFTLLAIVVLVHSFPSAIICYCCVVSLELTERGRSFRRKIL